MASIILAASKFALYRTDKTLASDMPYVNILAATDGGAGICKDANGRLWIFRQHGAKLQWRRSTDTTGDTYTAWADIVTTLVSDGIPAPVQLATTRIVVYYWKTNDKFYLAYSDNYGTDWTKDVEVVI